ncbi:hypothetical protein A4G20_02570 [Pasteurellaceae bacterium RH1A]|nr:hypothetical protein A4G20_02570 [Pasteurellaceae bacterium RH1A]
MLTLRLYEAQYQADLNYDLDEEQAQFTTLPKHWFDDQSGAMRVVILAGEQAIGFFILDQGQDKFDYTDDPNAVLLRSLSINPAYQGRGYAKAVMAHASLANFCRQHLPMAKSIVFGVNHKNTHAQAVYEAAGYTKLERTYMGIKGLQYVYWASLG